MNRNLPENDTGFAPWGVRHHRVRTPELILNFLFRVCLHLQWIEEREINLFCVILFHHAHNVVFFFPVRERSIFKHLIASLVDVGANSPWGENGSYPVHLQFVEFLSVKDLRSSMTVMKECFK